MGNVVSGRQKKVEMTESSEKAQPAPSRKAVVKPKKERICMIFKPCLILELSQHSGPLKNPG